MDQHPLGPAGIALAFGANIGTCITAALSSLGKPTEARRVAMVHVIFNVAGVLVWILFIAQLANVVMLISPVADGAEFANQAIVHPQPPAMAKRVAVR